MISQLVAKYPTDLSKSILIGDKTSDLELAENAGIGNAFLVGSKETEFSSFSVHRVFPTLYDVANRLNFENIAGKV